MVRIINGEIVQDDDPRLQQQKAPHQPETLQHRSTAPNSRGAGQAAAQPQNGPPPPLFRTGQDPGAMFPHVEISGVKITATAAMAMMAAYSMFGMRGLIGGGIVYFVYMKSQREQAAAAAGAQQGQGQQRGPPGAQQAAGGGYQYVPAAQPPSQAAPAGGTGGSSVFQGRGHRLGST